MTGIFTVPVSWAIIAAAIFWFAGLGPLSVLLLIVWVAGAGLETINRDIYRRERDSKTKRH